MIEKTPRPSPAPERFKPYPSYKDSGIEWLGRIPEHWGLSRLRLTITDCQNGVWGDEPDGMNDLPCIRVTDFNRLTFHVDVSQLTLRSVNARDARARIIRQGDLLLEKSGGGEKQPVGAVVLYDHSIGAVCSNFIARMSVADGFSSRFLSYLHAALYAARINMRSVKQNTGLQNLDSSSYLEEMVAFPDIEEQSTIADLLDRETAKIDALIEKKERLIELLQEKRTALITQAVTKSLDPNVPMKESGVDWLGKIPAHWTVKRLWHLTPEDRQIMYGIVLPGPNVDIGVSIVKGGDVSAERLHVDHLNRTTFEIESGYARSRLRGGDLVYAIRGSIGEVAIVPGELDGANLTQDAARIAYTQATVGQWLLYVLKSMAVFGQLEAGALGATIRGINIRDLKRVLVSVPPPNEQQAIADYLGSKTARIDALLARVISAIIFLKEYRTAFIAAAVTGKIDVRET